MTSPRERLIGRRPCADSASPTAARMKRGNLRHDVVDVGTKPAWAAKQLGHWTEVFYRKYARWIDGPGDDIEMEKWKRISAPRRRSRVPAEPGSIGPELGLK